MNHRQPADTKLVISAALKFTLFRAPVALAERVRARWPEMNVVHLSSYDALPQELPDTNVFVGYTLRPAQLQLAERLQWIHVPAAGVAQLMYPELRKSGITVTNASGVHDISMAEQVLGMVLVMARDFHGAVRYQLRHQWAQQQIWDGPARPRELAGQLAVFVGFGAAGRAIAERLRALHMRIWAVTHSGKTDSTLAERVFSSKELHTVLPEADFLILVAPETPDTFHMIAAPQLQAMKPAAILINAARGSLVDEPALISALERRTITGAALDVTSQEPLPPESPLWALENVLITPHLGGVSEHTWERQGNLLMDDLERWFDGRPLRNQVDLVRGY